MTPSDRARVESDPIHAMIAVWHRSGTTFYVQRSVRMQNYPGTWSLLSIQYDPAELPDHLDHRLVQPILDRLSEERLCGSQIVLVRYLTSATCSDNPMQRRVILHLYEVELACDPELNSDFYTDSLWMEPHEYERCVSAATCGLCLRAWSDYCLRHGWAERRFAPKVNDD